MRVWACVREWVYLYLCVFAFVHARVFVYVCACVWLAATDHWVHIQMRGYGKGLGAWRWNVAFKNNNTDRWKTLTRHASCNLTVLCLCSSETGIYVDIWYACMYTHTHAREHNGNVAQIRKGKPTHTKRQNHERAHTWTHTKTKTPWDYIYICLCTSKHKHTHTNTHTHTNPQTHTFIRTYTHAKTHTHTQTHHPTPTTLHGALPLQDNHDSFRHSCPFPRCETTVQLLCHRPSSAATTQAPPMRICGFGKDLYIIPWICIHSSWRCILRSVDAGSTYWELLM